MNGKRDGRRFVGCESLDFLLRIYEDTVAVRQSDFFKEHPRCVQSALTGSGEGRGTEVPSGLRVPSPFTTRVAVVRDLGKAQMWVSHSSHHHFRVSPAFFSKHADHLRGKSLQQTRLLFLRS